ncbi:MAG: hypothetical protein QW692_00635 [Nitrososphaerota archaeon]
MAERYVKVVFWDHAYHSEVDLGYRDVIRLSGFLTTVVGKVIYEDDERIAVAPWIAEGPNSDVYVILKSTIISVEELIPRSMIRRLRRRGK